jgi:hypothetical protein
LIIKNRIYNAEILPEKGVSLATASNWFFNFLLLLLFPTIQDHIKIYWVFLAYAFVCISALFYIRARVIETKDLGASEIEYNFRSESEL